jgi:hypothetical protein
MWGARAHVIDGGFMRLHGSSRTGRKTVPQAGDPGPRLRERRPKAHRPCLGCDRTILTTCAARLCRVCRLRAADFHGGVDEMHVLDTLTQIERTGVDR